MALLKTISGIRGTIGTIENDDYLRPQDIVKYTAAFASIMKAQNKGDKNNTIVVGRDARISGDFINKLVCGTLQSIGVNVLDLGLSTTPTVEMAVPAENALGGIILTASHNPIQWNALKLLNYTGEFINAEIGQQVLDIGDAEQFSFADVLSVGTYTLDNTYIEKHVAEILALPLVNIEAIKARNFRIAVDAINSTGGIAMEALFKALGVQQYTIINPEPTGHFAHNPEPLPAHLTEITQLIEAGGYDLGVVVDPDVDRLAFISNDGSYFGEEYTLVAVAEYVLKHTPGATVSNLSSTRALRDVTEKAGQKYHASAVGEVNVVTLMKQAKAVIGGEGNGGIIYPELHYGRDALVGVALFLSHLANSGLSAKQLRNSLPEYFISKNKIELTKDIDVDGILVAMEQKYSHESVNTIDGVKIDFADEWVHLRKSNTEPIIRIYSEAETEAKADALAKKIISDIQEIISK
jgi:phosphomannomutase